MVHSCVVTPHKNSTYEKKVTTQAEALEIAMKLEDAPIGEASLGMNQIQNQLASLSLQIEHM